MSGSNKKVRTVQCNNHYVFQGFLKPYTPVKPSDNWRDGK